MDRSMYMHVPFVLHRLALGSIVRPGSLLNVFTGGNCNFKIVSQPNAQTACVIYAGFTSGGAQHEQADVTHPRHAVSVGLATKALVSSMLHSELLHPLFCVNWSLEN